MLPGKSALPLNSGSCREPHDFLFAYYGDCLPFPGRKSFLDIFSGALDQCLAGIQAKLVFDVFAVGLDRLHAQIQGVRDLTCAKPRTEQMEDVHLAIGQIFNAGRSSRKAEFWLCFECFFEYAHRKLSTDVDLPA